MKYYSCFAVVATLFTVLVFPAAGDPKGKEVDEIATAKDFYFPSTGVGVDGQAILLGIDEYLLPLRDRLGTYLSTPRYRDEPVLRPRLDDPQVPDQVAAHFYGAVAHRKGKYQMWYYAAGLKEPGDTLRPDPKNIHGGPIAYAESDDGINWVRPALGQVEIRGSSANNAIALPDDQIGGVHVMIDEDDPDPARRYKMVYNPNNGTTWVIRTATSSDGITWVAADDFGIDQFLETAGVYKFNDLFVVHGQRLSFSDGGHRSGRQGRAILSTDFDHWLPGDVQAFSLPEPVEPKLRGPHEPYDQVHLGVGAATFDNVVIGLYGIWHNAPGDEDSQKQHGWFGYGKISCDLGLVISNDGLHFREPVKGHPFMSRFDTPVTPIAGKDFPTVLTQSGNGILNVGDETLIYYGRWRNSAYGEGYYGETALATLPRDRWGALGLYPSASQGDEGSVWSAPIQLPEKGFELVLNADHTDHLSVEISDTRFGLLDAFSGNQSGRSSATEGLDCRVKWADADLDSLAGQTVRFKINFRKGDGIDPRLFAVYLRTSG